MARVVDGRRFFILLAAIGGLAIFSSTLSKTPVLPLFAADFGATPAEIGWIVIASKIPEYSSRKASRCPHEETASMPPASLAMFASVSRSILECRPPLDGYARTNKQ